MRKVFLWSVLGLLSTVAQAERQPANEASKERARCRVDLWYGGTYTNHCPFSNQVVTGVRPVSATAAQVECSRLEVTCPATRDEE